MSAKPLIYDGTAAPLPVCTPLRAGPLTLLYQAGDLRYIKLGDRELIRRLYVAVRDHNWGTIPAQISGLQIAAEADSFVIHYDVVHQQGEIDFAWRGEITGTADGTIRFAMQGVARSRFLRNRIGICLLHPMACAGAPVRIEHVDGTHETSSFPVQIAPQLVIDGTISPMLPFAELGVLSHEVHPGIWAEVRFAGDIFETEDQRNWTDASYKTYSTPLRLPFPVAIETGTQIEQSVTLRLHGDSTSVAADRGPAPLTLRRTAAESQPIPRLGLGVASHGEALNARELERLRTLRLAHLRVDLHLAQPTWATKLRQAAHEAAALNIALEIALHLSDDAAAELAALRALLLDLAPPVARWLIFHQAEPVTEARWLALARTVLAGLPGAAPMGGGTNIYFTDLNRQPPTLAELDLVTYSLNPQVHAFDNASLVETLAAQEVTARSARHLSGDRPISVSPVTLLPRFNPVATGPAAATASEQLPADVDPRQCSLLGAGWTMGSLKYLAESGEISSITYYETSGWRGVMEREQGPPSPERFPSWPGAVFPLYHLLADVGEFVVGTIVPIRASEPLQVDGLLLHQDKRRRLLVANFTAEQLRVELTELGDTVQVRLLDETTAEVALRTPETFRAAPPTLMTAINGELTLVMRPYAYARLDWAEQA